MSLTVYNPYGANNSDGNQLTNNLAGKQGEQLNADLHGKWYNANLRKNVFHFTAKNFSVPGLGVITNGGLTFTLYNPAGSNVNAELIATTLSHDSATTVAGGIGWYTLAASSTQSTTAIAVTLATKATAGSTYFSGRVGDIPSGQVIPYTSVTTVTTGGGLVYTNIDLAGTFGATSDTTLGVADKQYEGRIILPPGQFITLGLGVGVGISASAQVVWAEWPFA